MKQLVAVLPFLLCAGTVVTAQDITSLEKIAPVVGFTKSDRTVTFQSQDNSQVQVTLLAPDLVRVRASFGKPMPAKDWSASRLLAVSH